MLNFEEVKTNLAGTLWRAPVPGGWLTMMSGEVMHVMPDGRLDSGWDWQNTMTFIPDPNHTWKLEVKEDAD